MTTSIRSYDKPYRGLPRELRDEIYRHLLVHHGVIHIQLRDYLEARKIDKFTYAFYSSTWDYKTRIPFELFLTNREMSEEALGTLYSESTFAFGIGNRNYDLHPNSVRSFFLHLPRRYRQMVKHVMLTSPLLSPHTDWRQWMSGRTLVNAEQYIGAISSLLRFLTRDMKLDTLSVVWTVSKDCKADAKTNQPAETVRRDFGFNFRARLSREFYGYLMLHRTHLEILRSAILTGDLGSLKLDYDFARQRVQWCPPWGTKTREYWSDDEWIYPHCVALSMNGLKEHQGLCNTSCRNFILRPELQPDAKAGGLMIEWEHQDPGSDSNVLTVRKRKSYEDDMVGEAYQALSLGWLERFMVEDEE